MSRIIRHKEEKLPREEKPIAKNIPKPKPKPTKVAPQDEPKPEVENGGISKTTLYARIGLAGLILILMSITVMSVYSGGESSDSAYLSEARSIYNSGYDNASSDIWYNYSTDKTYLEQLEFIEKYGGGNGTGKHYIPNINSKDGINKTEEKLIYAAGYTNGFADSMVHGYNTQRNNIPE